MFNFNYDLLIVSVPVILFALTIHEYAHAYVAFKLGDDTASLQGRLTLNPLMHLDLFGTILIFVVGFGWARPVPVNALSFNNPRKDMLKVALAGPAVNLITAIISGIAIRVLSSDLIIVDTKSLYFSIYGTLVVIMILNIVYGIVLAVFNMIPIPPLDGSRVLFGVLPDRLANKYMELEKYSIFLLLFIFIGISNFPSFNVLTLPLEILSNLLTGHDYIELMVFLHNWVN